MSTAHLFFNDRKPCIETKGVVVEEDWKFLKEVYPEHGFRAYFIGHCISKLANYLHKNGINSCETRISRPEFATITGLLSHLVLANPTGAHEQDDGQRTGSPRDQVALSERDSGHHALVALREAKEGEDGQGTEDAGLELAQLVVSAGQFPFTQAELEQLKTLLTTNKVE